MVQEKLNGQESEPKQSRAEEAKAGEAEANGRAVGLAGLHERPAVPTPTKKK